MSVFDKIPKEELQALSNEKTLAEIGEMFGVSGGAVDSYFKNHGITHAKIFRNKMKNINHEYFDVIDTEDKAYFLGFFIADGCVKKIQWKNKISYRMSFDNTIKDEESIKKMHDIICPDSKMSLKHVGENTTPQYTLQWNSDHMGQTLINKYNIGCKKTHDSNFVLPEGVIPDELWRHFIRGYMDGDGHISYESMYFCFTSEPFMKQIMSTFDNFNYVIYKIKGKTLDYWRSCISFSDKKREAMKKFLYDDANVFLKRKKDSLNTEIRWSLRNRVLEIVEHRVE